MNDIALSDAQLIWDYTGTEKRSEPLKVVDRARDDDPDYIASWGACDSNFNAAGDERRLGMLYEQFHRLVLIYEMDPQTVHEALLVIPEYRDSPPGDLLPARYQERD